MSEPLLGFKAGRAFRREGTNIVDCDPTKGAILLSNGEDGLLHFAWKNRTTNEVEEVSMLNLTFTLWSWTSRYTAGPHSFPIRCDVYQSFPILIE
jgi:hypothetical protein